MATQSAVIPASGTASNAVDLGGAVAGVLQMPAQLTGTTVTIKISIDGVTFTDVIEEAGEVNPITFSASAVYVLPIKTFSGKYLQLLSNDTEVAARTFPIFLRMPA